MEHRQPSCARLSIRDEDPPLPPPPPPPPPPPFACAAGAKSNATASSAFAASTRRARRHRAPRPCVTARGTRAGVGSLCQAPVTISTMPRDLRTARDVGAAALRSDVAMLPLTMRGKRGCRGANAAAVDTNARRSAEGAIISGATPPMSRIGRGCVCWPNKNGDCSPGHTRTERTRGRRRMGVRSVKHRV